MTPRVTTTGRDSFTPSRPQSEARRQHVHGPLLPMARPPWEPPIHWPVALMVVGFVALTIGISAF